jgi:hypothetical protein
VNLKRENSRRVKKQIAQIQRNITAHKIGRKVQTRRVEATAERQIETEV